MTASTEISLTNALIRAKDPTLRALSNQVPETAAEQTGETLPVPSTTSDPDAGRALLPPHLQEFLDIVREGEAQV